jgi:hypothetical protein
MGAHLVQEVLSTWLPRNTELTRTGDVNLNFVAFLEPQRIRNGRRKADGETVAPLCDLHAALLQTSISISSILRRATGLTAVVIASVCEAIQGT